MGMKVLYGVAAVSLAAWAFLFVTDTRVLTMERLVRPGESYVVDEWGDLGASQGSSLVCRYSNGRRPVVRVYHYSPNNLFGRDSCAFTLSD